MRHFSGSFALQWFSMLKLHEMFVKCCEWPNTQWLSWMTLIRFSCESKCSILFEKKSSSKQKNLSVTLYFKVFMLQCNYTFKYTACIYYRVNKDTVIKCFWLFLNTKGEILKYVMPLSVDHHSLPLNEKQDVFI